MAFVTVQTVPAEQLLLRQLLPLGVRIALLHLLLINQQPLAKLLCLPVVRRVLTTCWLSTRSWAAPVLRILTAYATMSTLATASATVQMALAEQPLLQQ